MGSGKTTVARLISREMNLNFIDSDEQVEKAANLKISEIFRFFGENRFRQFEEEVFKYIGGLENFVVSTGGGSFVDNFNNLKIAKKRGIIILLKTPFDVCYSRIKNSDRPMVVNNSFDWLKRLYLSRLERYEKMADFVVDGTLSPIFVSQDILDRLYL